MDDAPPRDRHELDAELAAIEGTVGIDAYMRLDERVHHFVWEAAGNPYLVDALERLWALSLRIWHLVLERVPALPAAVARAARAPRTRSSPATPAAPARGCASTSRRSRPRSSTRSAADDDRLQLGQRVHRVAPADTPDAADRPARPPKGRWSCQ